VSDIPAEQAAAEAAVAAIADAAVARTLAPPLKLDFGCGPNPREGFEGVDLYPFGGKVKHVLDVTAREPLLVPTTTHGILQADPHGLGRFKPWPWADDSVDEAHASHFLEHLTNLGGRWERVWFFNELFRVLKPGGQCAIIIPHWCSNRYYGDPTHKEPFSEMGFYYIKRDWRLTQAPHTDVSNNPDGYSCDFDAGWGYGLHQALLPRNQEYQQHALQFWKEAAQDIVSTLTKPAPKATP
jgi:SAM-dependent methyltransferase